MVPKTMIRSIIYDWVFYQAFLETTLQIEEVRATAYWRQIEGVPVACSRLLVSGVD